jgi:hypothetical protein
MPIALHFNSSFQSIRRHLGYQWNINATFRRSSDQFELDSTPFGMIRGVSKRSTKYEQVDFLTTNGVVANQRGVEGGFY